MCNEKRVSDNPGIVISKGDVEFLLSFVPAVSPDQVKMGLSPFLYVTGKYTGDLELAERVHKIVKDHGLTLPEIDEDD